VRWVGVLEVNGRRHELTRSRTVIGRATDADVEIDDPNASRRHVEVLWDGTRAQANDLGSTNGTLLNGARLQSSALQPDSVIEIGKTNIVFRVVPEAETSAVSRRSV
jgi:pSer/pThr/pTyr-binding forkhead associated (FHA) protein